MAEPFQSTYLEPQYNVDPKLTKPKELPASVIAQTQQYAPATQPLLFTRTAVNYSALAENSGNLNDTYTTEIGTIGADEVMRSFSLSAGIYGDTATGAHLQAVNRFRIDIVRGGTTIFTACVSVGSPQGHDSIFGTPELVLKKGDVINSVAIVNYIQCAHKIFVSVCTQPYT